MRPFLLILLAACGTTQPDEEADTDAPLECHKVKRGQGDEGTVQIESEVIAGGLDTPWSIAFLPDGDMLVTERPGTLSRVTMDGTVTPIATVPITEAGEGGLLGLVLHPDFAANSWLYLYFTSDQGGLHNRVERWAMASDGGSASFESVILEGIPARSFHNGGRLRFGPDGFLYIGTGEAGDPDRSQDPDNLGGKVLRLADDGTIPSDNPFPGSAAWVIGARNPQAFAWDDDRFYVADHGPSGLPAEGGRSGFDEVSIASAGDNLGWPEIYACEEAEGMVSPSMTWKEALPPGGAAVYTGSEIAEWRGDLMVGVLGFGDDIGHLHRLSFSSTGNVVLSEVYLSGTYGRIRDVVMGPDGGLYLTSSGCDDRGTCGSGDVIIRVGR